METCFPAMILVCLSKPIPEILKMRHKTRCRAISSELIKMALLHWGILGELRLTMRPTTQWEELRKEPGTLYREIRNFGILIYANSAASNKIQGNYIGTDITGTQALANGWDGVRIQDAPNNTIGGTTGTNVRRALHRGLQPHLWQCR